MARYYVVKDEKGKVVNGPMLPSQNQAFDSRGIIRRTTPKLTKAQRRSIRLAKLGSVDVCVVDDPLNREARKLPNFMGIGGDQSRESR